MQSQAQLAISEAEDDGVRRFQRAEEDPVKMSQQLKKDARKS